MGSIKFTIGLLLVAVFPVLGQVAEEDLPTSEELEKNERWSSFLPLYGDHVEAMGHELPLPFGVGLNFITLNRGIEVKEIKAGRNGQLNDVTDLVAVDATTHVDTLLARVDAWILPFLNVYFMGGYLDNTSDVDVTFKLPGETNDIHVASGGDLTGTVWGGGLQLAAGYGDFFVMLDGNYIYSELDSLLDEVIQVTIYSARTGWNGKIKGVPTRIWLGGMYWDADRVVKGSVGNLSFEVLQGPTEPTNLTLGTNVELSKRWSLFAEYAFNFEDLRMLAIGTGYRF